MKRLILLSGLLTATVSIFHPTFATASICVEKLDEALLYAGKTQTYGTSTLKVYDYQEFSSAAKAYVTSQCLKLSKDCTEELDNAISDMMQAYYYGSRLSTAGMIIFPVARAIGIKHRDDALQSRNYIIERCIRY